MSGLSFSPDGTAGSFNNLVGGDILRGFSGGTQVFTVDAFGEVFANSFHNIGTGNAIIDSSGNLTVNSATVTGNVNAGGTVTAAAFVGDGSGLTNLPGGGGGGTVTNVATGTGLTGGPITTTGTISIDSAVVPQLAASNTFTAEQDVTVNTSNPAVSVTQSGTGDAISGSSSSGIGVSGSSSSTNGVGVEGTSTAADNGTGVFGTGNGTTSSGVIGLANGTQGVGVDGTASSYTGNNAGVRGITLSPGGTGGEFFSVGGGDILRGFSGITEVFTVDGSGEVFANSFHNIGTGNAIIDSGGNLTVTSATVTGNVNAGGTVTAAAFVGDGSGLTNLPGGGGGNADTLDGLDSTQLARTDMGNSFIGNQLISGDVTATGGGSFTIVNVADIFFSGSINGGLRIEANATSPNVVGGLPANNVTAGAVGGTIGGGGSTDTSFPNNRVTDDWGTVGGGRGNQAGDNLGTTTDATSATVSGGTNNTANGVFATVGGGNSNTASGLNATVGGGASNGASGETATLGGGNSNTASGILSTLGGGFLNNASDLAATVGGCILNTASGDSSTVPGGRNNTATGFTSFAAGRRAMALHDGAFVWGDSTNADVASTAANQFTARASGGFTFFTDAGLTTGVTVGAGGGSWSSISDRNLKENFAPVEGQSLLARLNEIPIETWNYKAQDDSIRHMGPMAQDFRAFFGLGSDDKRISTVDADGVALAAIQELYPMILQKDEQLQKQQAQIQEQQAQFQMLQAQFQRQQTQMRELQTVLAAVKTQLTRDREVQTAALASPE